MSKKKMKTKTIVVLLTLAVGLFTHLPMIAQDDSDFVAILLNQDLDATEGGFLHQSFGNSMEGGFLHQSFGNSMEGGFLHQSFGNSMEGGFTHQPFGNGMEGGFTHQTFGNGVGGGFTHQDFGNDVEGGFTHQPFGNDTPLGGGLLILLSAGAGYAALKRTRQNNKQQ